MQPNSCRKTQTPQTKFGTGPLLGTIKPRLYVVLPSHGTSVGVVPSPGKRPPQSLHLHRGGSVELLGPFQQCMKDTMEQRERESTGATPQVHDWAFLVSNDNCSCLIHTSRTRKTSHITVNGSHETCRASQRCSLAFQQSVAELNINKVGVSLSSQIHLSTMTSKFPAVIID